MHQLACIAVVAAAKFALVTTATAQIADGSRESLSDQLQQVQKELADLRKDNQAMKGEIDELRAKSDADWLTEARAREIRGLVEDVLADADTRASLLQNGVMAGWLEHFFLASPDGRFNLVLEGMVQSRWVWNYRERPPFSQADQHLYGFETPRVRLTFRGHVFGPEWEYLIRSDFFGARPNALGFDNMLDAWVRYSFTDEWSLRFGQFKLPFNREELVSSQYQLAAERSLINQTMALGRSQGVELMYAQDTSRFSFMFSDGASPEVAAPQNNGGFLAQLLGGPKVNSAAVVSDTDYAVTARYERLLAGNWSQFNDFTSPRGEEFGMLLGVAAHHQHSESAGAPTFTQVSTRHLGGTIDLSIEWGGANAFIAGTYHYVDNPSPASPFATNLGIVHFIGVVAQAGVYLTSKWEVFIRGEYGQVSGDSGSVINAPDLNLVTLGTNYYFEGHDLKWTTDIGFGISDVSGAFSSDLAGYRPDPDETSPQVVFRTQFQLLF